MSHPIKSKGVSLKDTNSTSDAFGIILRFNFDSMCEWVPIAYQGTNIEGVHQARVALRRMRSAVGLFRSAIPRQITDAWGEEMKWIASAMGAARDLDVFISEGLKVMAGKIPLESGENKLLALATQRRQEAYLYVMEMIDSDRYKTFVTDFPKWLDAKDWYQADLSTEVRKRMDKSITLTAIKLLNSRMSKTLAFGAKMGSMSSEELHALRIECKKLRYAFEFFQPLFNEKSMLNFGLHLKGLQDLLGVMNDVSVMPGLLENILRDETDVATLQYAGALLGWRARQYEEIRGRLDERWQEFASSTLPWMK